jgi:hypothetical protein
MPVDQNEILSKAVATLRADAGLLALTGDRDPENPGEARVWNHVPQNEDQPYVLVVWESGSEGDTKDSTGFEGRLNHEVVSTHHGDSAVLKMQDAVIAAYELNPIVLVAGEIICFQFASGSTPVNTFSTHRAVFFYNVMVDDDGVAGIPLPPVAGGSIVVQENGVDLNNTPHTKLNFGLGVEAVDAGGGVAEIRAADASLTLIDAVGIDKGKADLAGGVRNFKWNMAEDGQLLPQNVPSGLLVIFVLILTQQTPGGHTFTAPPNTRWDGGNVTPNTETDLARDIYVFMTEDGGASYDGAAVSLDSK